MLTGVYKYNNHSTVHMQLGFSSGGFTTKWNSSGGWNIPGGYTPHKFTINESYIFGSVKHNGVWQGIRMYIPE